MASDKDDLSPATTVVTAGRRPEWTGGIVNPPVWRASTILYDDVAQLRAAAGKDTHHRLFYGRRGTPTQWALADALTDLEGGAEATFLYPSGVAAIAAALLAVLSAPQTHGAHTRARTVAVFRSGVEALCMVCAAHPAAVADAAEAVLPPWLAALSAVLSADPAADAATDDWDAHALRAEALRTLLALHTAFPKALAPHLPSLLSAALAHLPALHPAFVDALCA